MFERKTRRQVLKAGAIGIGAIGYAEFIRGMARFSIGEVEIDQANRNLSRVLNSSPTDRIAKAPVAYEQLFSAIDKTRSAALRALAGAIGGAITIGPIVMNHILSPEIKTLRAKILKRRETPSNLEEAVNN